jgi:hypothetical protein
MQALGYGGRPDDAVVGRWKANGLPSVHADECGSVTGFCPGTMQYAQWLGGSATAVDGFAARDDVMYRVDASQCNECIGAWSSARWQKELADSSNRNHPYPGWYVRSYVALKPDAELTPSTSHDGNFTVAQTYTTQTLNIEPKFMPDNPMIGKYEKPFEDNCDAANVLGFCIAKYKIADIKTTTSRQRQVALGLATPVSTLECRSDN